ncbi:hypothetical protein [Actinomadura sp. GTD37]|uniref:hypothetical protein n=1 Tax=Actinomadura sp. GTD37 TaxID=1778030 RepID=UPI0035C10125
MTGDTFPGHDRSFWHIGADMFDAFEKVVLVPIAALVIAAVVVLCFGEFVAAASLVFCAAWFALLIFLPPGETDAGGAGGDGNGE